MTSESEFWVIFIIAMLFQALYLRFRLSDEPYIAMFLSMVSGIAWYLLSMLWLQETNSMYGMASLFWALGFTNIPILGLEGIFTRYALPRLKRNYGRNTEV